MPRIAPLPEPEWSGELRRILEAPTPAVGERLGDNHIFSTLARHPDLFRAWLPFGGFLLGRGVLPARERELLILRTCARAGAEYEWGVHAVVFAEAVGLGERQLAATARGSADDPAFSAADAQLIAAADALYDTGTIPDELWAALAGRFAHDQLLELIIVAGWYRVISYLVNALQIEREPWAARFP